MLIRQTAEKALGLFLIGFSLMLASVPPGDAWRAKLWLCDLAGSERISKSEATGDRMREAQFINKSLSALGDCINALARRASHVPFRNSKLTYLLQVKMASPAPIGENRSPAIRP